MMELTCIRCPIGCSLTVTKNADGTVTVTGNNCPRGAEYGRQEMLEPKRTITSVKKIKNGTISLKTNKAVPKEKYFDVLKAIKNVPEKRSYSVGGVLIKNVCGTNADVVITNINIEKFQKKISQMRDFFVVLLDWFYIAKKWVLIQMYSDLKKIGFN